jgi:ribosomal protein S13
MEKDRVFKVCIEVYVDDNADYESTLATCPTESIAENIAKAICKRSSWEAFVPADYLLNERVTSIAIICEWHDVTEDMDEFYRQTVYGA